MKFERFVDAILLNYRDECSVGAVVEFEERFDIDLRHLL